MITGSALGTVAYKNHPPLIRFARGGALGCTLGVIASAGYLAAGFKPGESPE